MSQYVPREVDPIDQPKGRVFAVGVNPSVLTWARLAMNWDLDLAAKKTGIPIDKLQAAEKGEERVLTFKQLIKIADKFKRAVSVFYLDEVPDKDFELPDFRTSVPMDVISGELNVEIREVLADRELAIELEPRPDYDYSYIGLFEESTEVEEVVDWIREKLDIRSSGISKLRDEKVLYYWRDQLEKLGILVFQFPRHQHFKIDENVTRGFSFSILPYPIIGLNGRETPYARIFTLFHEFAHLIIDMHGICTPVREISNIEIESKCNQIAATVLVPDRELRNELKKFPNEKSNNAKEKVSKLSQHFKVSYSVILIRLLSLNLIKRKDFIYLMDSLQEPSKTRGSESGGHYVVTWKSRSSPRFINLVFDSINNGEIGYIEAMTKMGVSSKVFSSLEGLSKGLTTKELSYLGEV